jgi:hypothetical protein
VSLSSFMGNPDINCPRELPSAPKSWLATCTGVAAIGAAMSEDGGPAESRPNRPRRVGAAEGHFPPCSEAVHPVKSSYGAPAHEDTLSVVIDAANNPRVTSGGRPLARIVGSVAHRPMAKSGCCQMYELSLMRPVSTFIRHEAGSWFRIRPMLS